MSQDKVENAVEASEPVVEEITLPLTRVKREELNALSLEVYGKRLRWQKILAKGQLKPSVELNNAGNAVSVMRMHHFTVSEIYRTMAQVLKDRDAAVEAAKNVDTKKLEE
jgi:hypothetical protein